MDCIGRSGRIQRMAHADPAFRLWPLRRDKGVRSAKEGKAHAEGAESQRHRNFACGLTAALGNARLCNHHDRPQRSLHRKFNFQQGSTSAVLQVAQSRISHRARALPDAGLKPIARSRMSPGLCRLCPLLGTQGLCGSPVDPAPCLSFVGRTVAPRKANELAMGSVRWLGCASIRN